jgi:hypothetical protein
MADPLSDIASPTPGNCTALKPLLHTEHYELDVDSLCKLVLLRRTELPFVRLTDLDACFDALERGLAEIVREQYAVLIDLRRGPARNDAGFEAAMQRNRQKTDAGFRRSAFIVSTAVGRLQIQRMIKDMKTCAGVAMDPSGAFRLLGLPGHEI